MKRPHKNSDDNKLRIEKNLNNYQMRIYQRLIQIIPDNKEKRIIEELLVMHIKGINQDIRLSKVKESLGISEGGTGED